MGVCATSFEALQRVFANDVRLPVELRVWILTQLSDMAERLGDDRAAQQYLQAALQAAPDDGFCLAAYADLLIRERRYPEVVSLLAGREAQDNLLLRLSIAGEAMGNVPRRGAGRRCTQRACRPHNVMGTRCTCANKQCSCSMCNGTRVRALQIAARNWQQQREPADVRIYWRAARAAHGAAGTEPAEAELKHWLALTRYEDATLADASK